MMISEWRLHFSGHTRSLRLANRLIKNFMEA